MATRTALVFETQARTYRHTWRGSVISTFLNPVLFLAAMGLGLGTLVDRGSGTAGLDGVPYLTFLAPGLLAATAMQTGAGDGAWPVMAGIKWRKTYEAILATPIGVSDLVLGHLAFVAARLTFVTVVYAVVTALFGAVGLGWALLSVPAGVLTGLAFAAPTTAYAAWLEDDHGLSSLFRFGIVPMFLFSGTFFPISQLPGWIQPLAYVTPLWHGVDLGESDGAAQGTDARSVDLGRLPGGMGRSRGSAVHPYVPQEAAEVTSASLLARIAPVRLRGVRRSRYLIERNVLVYRRAWVIVFSGFFEPLFYLLSIGIGIGKLVGDITLPNGTVVEYATFVAPALLASSAMNGAVFESTMNIFFKLKFAKIYDAILATPMGPTEVAIGEIAWSLIRGLLYAAGFLVVMIAMGLMPSPLGLLALPAALLIGFAFAAVGMSATTFMTSWQDFDLVTLVTLPLFLFSATFYPLDVYPGWLQVVARFSPLYHGVDLIRGLTLGILEWSLLGHVAVLVGMGLVGVSIAARRIEDLLLT